MSELSKEQVADAMAWPAMRDHVAGVVADYDARIAAGVDATMGSPIRATKESVEAMRAWLTSLNGAEQ